MFKELKQRNSVTSFRVAVSVQLEWRTRMNVWWWRAIACLVPERNDRKAMIICSVCITSWPRDFTP